jgi:hypothetical protein
MLGKGDKSDVTDKVGAPLPGIFLPGGAMTVIVGVQLTFLWLTIMGLWLAISYMHRRIKYLEESPWLSDDVMDEVTKTIETLTQNLDALREHDRELHERLRLLTRQITKERT